MNRVHNTRQGFTLVELMLAMTFISVLLLAIAMTVIQVGSMYNRGMTLKETSQAARDISSDIQRSILTSPAFSTTEDYIVHATDGYGRVCLGTYTYIWNLGRTPAAQTVKYDAPSEASKRINIVKVSDRNKTYCVKTGTGALAKKNISVQDTDANNVKELLPAGDHSLVLYKFVLASDTVNAYDPLTGQQLYQLRFTISTGNLTAIDTATDTCLPPGNVNSDLTYCTIQDFSLVVRAGNRFN